jgi:hypothetical protein
MVVTMNPTIETIIIIIVIVKMGIKSKYKQLYQANHTLGETRATQVVVPLVWEESRNLS